MPRLIDNQIWNARSFSQLSIEDKLLFLYLETSPETNYYGVFILPNDTVISARTGLTSEKVKNSLQELEKLGKITMVNDHLIIFDYFDRQKNNQSEKTMKGLENFEKSLPKEVLDTWLKGRPSPLEGGIKGVSSPLEESKVNESKDKIKINIKENKNIIASFFESENLESLIKSKIVPYEKQVWFEEQAKATIASIKEKMVDYYVEGKGKTKEIKNMKLRFYKFLEGHKRSDFYKYLQAGEQNQTISKIPPVVIRAKWYNELELKDAIEDAKKRNPLAEIKVKYD